MNEKHGTRAHRQKQRRFRLWLSTLLLGVFLLSRHPIQAQDTDPVLDLLVKHHVISDQEAQNARADIARETESTNVSKTILSPSITEIKLYGDVRERFGINEAGATNDHPSGKGAPNSGSDHSQVNRFRLRLRVGLEAKLADNWMFGFRFETSNDGRSTNVTEGSVPAFNKASAPTSTFVTGASTGTAVSAITSSGKTVKGKVLTGVTTGKGVTAVNWGYTVFVGELYVRYKPAPWLSVEGGKMPNPMISTPMVWDPDITPEGFSEQFSYTITPFSSADKIAVNTGKNIAAPEKDEFSIDLFGNFGQFVYSANSPANSFGTSGGADGFPSADQSDTFLLAWQGGSKFNFSKATSLLIAPTLYNYTGHTTNVSTANFQGDGPQVVATPGATRGLFAGFNQTGVNNLLVLDLPVEFDFKLGRIPASVFGDYAINLDARERATKAGHPDQADQNTAYQAGFEIGNLKRKGDWTLRAYWQHSEQFALDPSLVDNNIFDGRLNMQGPALTVGYNFTDAVSSTFSYNYGQRLNSHLGTGGPANAFSLNPLHDYSFYYWDLILSF